MKKIISLSFLALCTISGFSQTQKIVLNKKQQLKFNTTLKGTTSIDAMTQTMDITTNSSSSKNILVTDVAKDKYDLDFTTIKLKMDFSIMGESKKFDSENKADTSGDLKDFSKNINVPKKLFLYKDGKAALADTTTKETPTGIDAGNPFTNIIGKAMAESANEPTALESYFMLIPADKKLGDSWSDSTINGDNKVYNTYTWDSTTANIANIKIAGKLYTKLNSEIPDLGMSMDATINSTITEIRKVDLKTGVIVSKKNNAVIDGSAEMMGMSLPITGSTEATTMMEAQ